MIVVTTKSCRRRRRPPNGAAPIAKVNLARNIQNVHKPVYTWKLPSDRLGILSISSILPPILPQTSSQTQGNSRVSRMELQTPSVFHGNFRKRKVLGTLCFPFCLPERYILLQAKRCICVSAMARQSRAIVGTISRRKILLCRFFLEYSWLFPE